ncbi:hypothetical protein BZB76_1756 [Actinomadura pelletieri DSM 43383]|uniref:Lactococcin 972 family bacteriocin n=1 Tax=Actinomadura pelletieri DSM 43383 TaxID=1120940 RepID=A0A495QSM3_9ACTN|nr:hypothetical protein BZB76_1756 [Actinomadura pelletieri DSM 43383]
MTPIKVIIQGAILGITLSGAGLVLASTANAGGTSPKTSYGCYAKWWNTSWSGYCTPYTGRGSVGTQGYCMPGTGWSTRGPYALTTGRHYSGFGSGECTIKVRKASTWPA